jgi:predicted nucleic acid-binding Zn finger protein
MNGKTTCYHLESADLAKKENKIEKIIFSDDEFTDFLSGLLSDL